MKAKAENNAGKKSIELDAKRNAIRERIEELRPLKERKPTFILPANFNKTDTVLHIIDAEAGYNGQATVKGVNIVLKASERLVISGRNGSGKSTLAKAIMGLDNLRISGVWYTPKEIGYLDQHYANLEPDMTVLESVREVSRLPDTELRSHLGDFLFYTNSEVNCRVKDLSGGEKARLSLAVIALSPKVLLILDEISNNTDIKTKRHIAEILRQYPAALILISHEKSFVKAVCGYDPPICEV
jgi:ATPase subunit of ABC transporter with duplicated ATPase domains